MMERSAVNKINRIKYLDGLRGIDCMMIVIHHFLLAFYPTSYYGGFNGAHGKYSNMSTTKQKKPPFYWRFLHI